MSAEKKALNLNGIFNLNGSQHESVIYGCLSQNYVLVNLYNTGLNSANSSVTPVKFVDHNCIDHCNYWLKKKKIGYIFVMDIIHTLSMAKSKPTKHLNSLTKAVTEEICLALET